MAFFLVAFFLVAFFLVAFFLMTFFTVVAVVAVVAVVVAVVVCATHARNGHAERILAFRLKFKHVLACFHVEHVDRRSSIAALGVVKRHLRAERIVVAVVVLIFVVVVFLFVVIVLLAVVGEGEVVAAVIAVKLLGFVGVMCEGVNVGCGRSGHRGAKFVDENGLEVKGVFTAGHGVGGVHCRAVSGQVGKGPIDPGLQAQAVVEEDISTVQADDVRCTWLVVVDRHVRGAHHLDVDEAASDGFSQLRHVVRRGNDGRGFWFFVASQAACEAGENQQKACNKGSLPLGGHGLPFHH